MEEQTENRHMERQSEQPFESIESAYDFFRLLSEAVAEAKQDIEGQIQGQMQRESGAESSRRLDALRIVCYSVEKLEFHTNCSRRILNDLRSLRRLLFEERTASRATRASQPVTTTIAEMPAAPVPVQLPSGLTQPGGKGGTAVAA
jgi:hypothetical protein